MLLQCVHHIPGRLRLKKPSLRGDEAALDVVCRWLLATEGVTAVTASAITGSILVNYDVTILQPELLDEHLRRLGASSEIRPQAKDGPFEHVVQILVRKLFEHVVEVVAAAAIEAAI